MSWFCWQCWQLRLRGISAWLKVRRQDASSVCDAGSNPAQRYREQILASIAGDEIELVAAWCVVKALESLLRRNYLNSAERLAYSLDPADGWPSAFGDT